MIDITGLDKASVLAALYNAAKPQGMGFLHYDPTPMTQTQASEILRQRPSPLYFDYLKGRVMKVELEANELDERLYDRDNGSGAALTAIESVRSTIGKP